MLYFKAKVHQLRFQLGLCLRPRWVSLQRSPELPAGFIGPTSKGKEGRRRDSRGRKGVRAVEVQGGVDIAWTDL